MGSYETQFCVIAAEPSNLAYQPIHYYEAKHLQQMN